MQIKIPVNHNYFEESPLSYESLGENFGARNRTDIRKIDEKLFSSVYELILGNQSHQQLQIVGFKNQKNHLEDEERLVLKLYSKEAKEGEKQYFIQTGLYAGVVYHKDYTFNITTKYGDVFLRRMLNFVSDIYIDNESTSASKDEKINEFEYIIAYLFIQSLEKALVLGLPKEYQSHTQRSHKVRGKIDINAYLRTDIPFQGKLTTTFREQTYIQEIIDVLFLACKKLERKFGKDIHSKILSVYQLLKLHYSGNYSNSETIHKAKNHRVLHNPMYAPFQKILEYAEIILLDQDLSPSDKENHLETSGFLFDISQLFEVYLEKLLSKHFTDWTINSQEELHLYDQMFYKRRMFPDLVMKHKYSNNIIVFDAKFKNMRLIKKDLDRSDFYQIHTYIQYYQPNVLLGGLIYPLSKPIDTNKSYSEALFGSFDKKETKFIVDGINVNEGMSMSDLIENENDFLSRLDLVIEQSAINERKHTEVI